MSRRARLGQNFLVNRSLARRIVSLLLPVSGPIVEVGPGRGILTELLVAGRQSQPLVLVELDPRLCADLERRFAGQARVICGDILRLDPAQFFAGAPFSLIGNLPFYISHQVLDWVIAHQALLRKAVVMLQNEFVAKLLATPGSRERHAQSVIFQCLFRVASCFNVHPGSFAPAPRVRAQVIEFEPRTIPADFDFDAFYRFLMIAFAGPRKTLMNNLNSAWPAPLLREAIGRLGLDARCRAFELLPATLLSLFAELKQAGH